MLLPTPTAAAASPIGVARAAGTAHLLVAEEAADDAVATVARRAANEAFMVFCAEKKEKEREEEAGSTLTSSEFNCDKSQTQKKKKMAEREGKIRLRRQRENFFYDEPKTTMPLSPSTVHQTRSMAPVAFLGMRMHQSGPPRRATTPARRASGRRAPAKTRFSDRSSVFDATTPPLPAVVAAAASTSSSSEAADRPANNSKPVSIRLPIGPGDQADQAAAACVAAWREAKDKNSPCRLLVTLSLPLVGATDLDDWPGGIRQQFKAAKPMVERMLSEIRKQADGGGFFREAPRSSLWDDGEFLKTFFFSSSFLFFLLLLTEQKQKKTKQIQPTPSAPTTPRNSPASSSRRPRPWGSSTPSPARKTRSKAEEGSPS